MILVLGSWNWLGYWLGGLDMLALICLVWIYILTVHIACVGVQGLATAT